MTQLQWLASSLCVLVCSELVIAQNVQLERQLRNVDPTILATEVQDYGDAKRGAAVFQMQAFACAQCHRFDSQPAIGPSLAGLSPAPSLASMCESVLNPSLVIKPEYALHTLVLESGEVVVGKLFAKTDATTSIQLLSGDLQVRETANDEIVAQRVSDTSPMPAGLVGILESRQQFLDLMKFLADVSQRDASYAQALLASVEKQIAKVPDYEQRIDHAGMIRDFDREAFERGEVIYARACANCHGTLEAEGSLPTSLRFASGKFKHGYDPFAMYQTLTHGNGMMQRQAWMVPQQKYDVIHYIREEYLKEHNPSQYHEIDTSYLESLPVGDERGPEPVDSRPWQEMDYGPNLVATIEVGQDGSNIAYKGHTTRVDVGVGGVSHGNAWMLFDLDTLRLAAAWSGESFIDYRGINFDGQHNIHPRVTGHVKISNGNGPGWARPGTTDFSEDRVVGRDGKYYGPVPRDWARWKGMYYHGDVTLLSYSVGESDVLERHSRVAQDSFVRSFRIGSRNKALTLKVCETKGLTQDDVAHVDCGDGSSWSDFIELPLDSTGTALQLGVVADEASGMQLENTSQLWRVDDGKVLLHLPVGEQELEFSLVMRSSASNERRLDLSEIQPLSSGLLAMTKGGPNRWPQQVLTEAQLGHADGAFAVDTLTYPLENPWNCRMRLTGHDFYADGDRAAVCDWDGNVWEVSGLSQLDHPGSQSPKLTWKRIVSGLFQPLGLRIIDEQIYLTCRDQLCRLQDLNDDGAIDFVECINNDHQVTEHFHEFAMGLQVDDEGNFYYAKSARHALKAIVPHHGTLLKVSPDGGKTEIVANGFRAANGVCLNSDGSFYVTDQEGHWNPKNRINLVHPGGFYGNMFGYHDKTDDSDAAMEQPLCWITNAFDRSPAELLWVENAKWGPLNGALLSLSYGYGKVYVVLPEVVDGHHQGGMVELPIPQFPTGTIRGRFHPRDGQLYLTGMYSWAGNQQEPGGFFRLRYTGKPISVPVSMHVLPGAIELTFAEELAADTGDARFHVKSWDIHRSANYGSEHYDEQELRVAKWDVFGKRVVLHVPELEPTRCMEVLYSIQAASGQVFEGTIHNTIHAVPLP